MQYRTLPTEFTPEDLETLRQLVAEKQSTTPPLNEAGQKLHNLGRKLTGYCDTVRMAQERMRFAC